MCVCVFVCVCVFDERGVRGREVVKVVHGGGVVHGVCVCVCLCVCVCVFCGESR